MAVAVAAEKMGAKAIICVPNSTPQYMIERLHALGAEVSVEGTVWDEADQLARQLCRDDGYGYFPSLTTRRYGMAMPQSSKRFTVCAAVKEAKRHCDVWGGGGLLIGIVKGLQVGWGDVPVIAGERWCNRLQRLRAKVQVTLPAITSIAKSLGALTVSSEALNCDKSHTIYSSVCTYVCRQCMHQLANDHRILVEPACGAALPVSMIL